MGQLSSVTNWHSRFRTFSAARASKQTTRQGGPAMINDAKNMLRSTLIDKVHIPANLSLVLIALVILVLVAFGSNAQGNNDSFTLTILHTNDLHSHDESFKEKGRIKGGLARIGQEIRQLRDKDKSESTVVIDSGDIFQGTPLFTKYLGQVEIDLLNKIGYDFYTIGNHEFDEGADNLARQLQNAHFKILCCNLDAGDHPLSKLMVPYSIKTIKGHKVGFVGAITPDIEGLAPRRGTIALKQDKDLPYPESYIAPIKAQIDDLKRQGVDKIILVTHCGVDVDKTLAAHLPEIDAIIGGHSHTPLHAPVVVPHQGGQGSTYIVQTGCYGRNLGYLQLTFDDKGRVDPERSRYRLIQITDKMPEAADLKDYIAQKQAPLNCLRETICAQATDDFDNNWRNLTHDSALGNLISDAFADIGKSQGVTIAFENRGGIRSRIDKGPISQEKIEELLPFDNHLAYATVSGAMLKRALEHSVAGSTGGRYLEMSGIKMAYDLDAEPGKRVLFVYARHRDKSGKETYKKLDEQDQYRIAMTDYSFKGGEGYDFKQASDVVFYKERLNEPFKDFLQKSKVVRPRSGERFVGVSSKLPHDLLHNRFNGKLANASKKTVDIYISKMTGITKLAKTQHDVTIPLSADGLEQIAKDATPVRAREIIHNFDFHSRPYHMAIVVSGRKGRQSNGEDETRLYSVSHPFSTCPD